MINGIAYITLDLQRFF